jgi:hypothetical protein
MENILPFSDEQFHYIMMKKKIRERKNRRSHKTAAVLPAMN